MLALQGIKIVDISRQALVYCSWLLGDLGAEVIHVAEPPNVGGRRLEQTGGRVINQPPPRDPERSLAHNATMRNKRSIVLNLKEPAGVEVYYRLADGADVVIEGFRPGVADRLGIGYQTLSARNPRLVYCSLTGYGHDGPYRDLVGHDINYIALGGALGVTGERSGKGRAIPINLIADNAGAGLHGAIGILAALMARERTGRGQFVDVALLDSVVSLMGPTLAQYFDTGFVTRPANTITNGAKPWYNVFETSDGKFITVGCFEPWFYANLAKVMGCEDLAESQWEEGAGRDELFRRFEAAFKKRTRDEWFAIMRENGYVCVGPVLEVDEVACNEQVKARGMVVEIEHPRLGKVRQPGIAIKLSQTPGRIRSLARRPGEDTGAILAELGYSKAETAELVRRGVALEAPPSTTG